MLRETARWVACVLLAALPQGCRAHTGAVRTIAEARHERVVLQQWDLSCGAAALATLLTYDFDDPHSEQELASAMLGGTSDVELHRQQGFSFLDLQRFAEAHGYTAEGYGELTLQDLNGLKPAIVPVRVNGFDHFVVFRGLEDGRVLLADPAYGNRTLSARAFEKAWEKKVAFVLERAPSVLPASAELAPQTASPAPQREEEERDVTTRALERALLKQSGLVLPPWRAELVPQLDYTFAQHPGFRRDIVITSLGVRVGLPWTTQAELSVPWVVFDHATDLPDAAGPGDAEAGLTKLLFSERGPRPSLLLSGTWKSTTGTLTPQTTARTGSGFHSLEGRLTAVKRDDPVVLSLSGYAAWNARKENVDPGDAFGGIASIFLAATPNTSVSLDADIAWIGAPTIDGELKRELSFVSGIVSVGLYTNIVPRLLFNLSVGVGVTPNAPDLQLSLGMPFRL